MAKTTDGLITFFSDDHRECDDLWAALEAAASGGDQAKAATLWPEFSRRLSHHLQMEEDVLFPAFEAATGMRGGPTMVMRAEHTQMRGVLAEMDRRMSAGDLDGLLDQGDTLLMLIQQHNAKEEGMLYPMAEQALGAQWASLAVKLDAS